MAIKPASLNKVANHDPLIGLPPGPARRKSAAPEPEKRTRCDMRLRDAWQRIRMIWSFAIGALISGAIVAASFFWFATHPLNPRTPDRILVAPVLPGAGPPPGWHFVPNGVEGCADKYGCARPSFDSDFWEWVAFGEQNCADEHGCARPRLPRKSEATPVEKPERKGEKPEVQPESDAGSQSGSKGGIPAGHE